MPDFKDGNYYEANVILFSVNIALKHQTIVELSGTKKPTQVFF